MENPGWDWKTLAPYYRKCFALTLPPDDVCKYLGLDHLESSNHRGVDGPIKCGYNEKLDDTLGKAWVDTFKSFGFDQLGDPWAGDYIGGYANASSVDPATKTRSYSASDYYEPVKNRPNLHVVIGSQVDKIIFESSIEGNKAAVAVGVIAKSNSGTLTYRVHREVIVAAGALQSPKLLELSGVGDANLLEKHGIEAIVDNANVGENFQDHPVCGMSFEVRENIATFDDLNRQELTAVKAAIEDYQKNKKGPLCDSVASFQAFLPVMDCIGTVDGKKELESILKECLDSKKAPKHPYLPPIVQDYVRKITTSSKSGSMNYVIYAAEVNPESGDAKASNITATSMLGNFFTILGFLGPPTLAW